MTTDVRTWCFSSNSASLWAAVSFLGITITFPDGVVVDAVVTVRVIVEGGSVVVLVTVFVTVTVPVSVIVTLFVAVVVEVIVVGDVTVGRFREA